MSETTARQTDGEWIRTLEAKLLTAEKQRDKALRLLGYLVVGLTGAKRQGRR